MRERGREGERGSEQIPTVSYCSVILLGVGVCSESFNFEFKGAAGLVLGDAAKESFSLVSLGGTIPTSVENPEDFGIRWIETVYYLFALGMPFCCLLVMIILWTVRLTVKQQVRK